MFYHSNWLKFPDVGRRAALLALALLGLLLLAVPRLLLRPLGLLALGRLGLGLGGGSVLALGLLGRLRGEKRN